MVRRAEWGERRQKRRPEHFGGRWHNRTITRQTRQLDAAAEMHFDLRDKARV